MTYFDRIIHNVETSPQAVAGPLRVEEVIDRDFRLKTSDGSYSLQSCGVGTDAVRLTVYRSKDSIYYGVSGIKPDDLDDLIGLLTVARDKLNGVRP